MATTILKQEIETTTLIDSPDSQTTYIGLAMIGSTGDTAEPIWQIIKILTSDNTTIINHADGNIRFDNKWSERVILNYS